MAGDEPVQFKNGSRLFADLRAAPTALKAAQRQANAKLGREVRGWVRSAATAGTPQQRRMAGGIGSSSNSTSASLTVRNTRGAPGAAGAFFGSKRYAQFPGWVGSSWKPAQAGEGPYVINPALARHSGEIETLFLASQLEVAQRTLNHP